MPETSLLIKAKNLTKQAFDEIQKSLDKTASYFDKLAAEAKQSEKGIIGSLNRVKAPLEKNREGLQALTIGLGAVAAGSGLLAKSFLDAATQMETMKIALTATVGSASEAEKQLARLREVAKLPGLGFPEAVQGSVNLQQVGFSAEMAERMLTGVGNALVLVGKGRAELRGVTTAFVQMHTKGKVLAEEINQIAERMPQIRKAMLQAFGTADSEVIQKMGISTQQFISGIMVELEKLPKATGGAANAVENLADAWFQLRAELGEHLLPAFAKIINTLSSVVEWFNKLSDRSKAIISWGVTLTAGISAMGAAFGGVLLVLPGIIAGITTLAALIPTISASLAAFALGPGGIVLASVASLGLLTYAFKKLSDAIVDVIERQTVLATTMKSVGNLADIDLNRKLTNTIGIIEQYDRQLLLLYKDEQRNAAVIADVIEKREALLKIYKELQAEQKKRQGVISTTDLETEMSLRQRQLELIEDSYEKERQQARLTYEEKVAGYQKEIKDAEQLSKAIAIERQILAKTLTDIDRKETDERINIRNEWLKKHIQSSVLATNAELAEIEKRRQAEVNWAIEEIRIREIIAAKIRAKAMRETDFQIRLAEGFREVSEKTDAEIAQSAANYLAEQEIFVRNNAKTKAMIDATTTEAEVQEFERRMSERDNLTEKILTNSEIEVQAFYNAVEKQKEYEKQIERFSYRAGQIFAQIPSQLAAAFITGKQSLSEVIKGFFADIGTLILQEVGRIIAMQIGAAALAGGGLLGGIGSALPIVGLGLAAYQLYKVYKGSFDSPINDRFAQQIGRQTAMVYGASFDNPVNDYRARMQGTLSASKALGERSAGDMVTNFQQGFIQRANEMGGSEGSLSEILSKLERRLGETPRLQILLDGREITANVLQHRDRLTSRREAY